MTIASTGSTTTVLIVVLVIVGLVMIGTTVWLVRSTRTDVPALAPLEVMGTRGFTRATPDARVAALEGARPAGALPPAPMVPFDDDEVPAPVALEAEPAAAEPEVVEPDVVEAEVVEPAVVEPAVVEPEVVDAEILDAEVVEPVHGDERSDVQIDDRVTAPESS